MNNLPSLLSCPFCGGIPKYVYRKQFKEWFVMCKSDECKAVCSMFCHTNFEAKSAQAAADRWNKTIDRVMIEDIERIET